MERLHPSEPGTLGRHRPIQAPEPCLRRPHMSVRTGGCGQWTLPAGHVRIPVAPPSWITPGIYVGTHAPCPGLSQKCVVEAQEANLMRSLCALPAGEPAHALTALSSQDLIKVHHSFLRSIDVSMMAGGSALAKVFLEFKER